MKPSRIRTNHRETQTRYADIDRWLDDAEDAIETSMTVDQVRGRPMRLPNMPAALRAGCDNQILQMVDDAISDNDPTEAAYSAAGTWREAS